MNDTIQNIDGLITNAKKTFCYTTTYELRAKNEVLNR
jgi:hypothetical protein